MWFDIIIHRFGLFVNVIIQQFAYYFEIFLF